MCWVSTISDLGRQMQPFDWTPKVFDIYKEIKKAAEEVDKATGQPECHDPKKGEWEKAVEERLRKLEAILAEKEPLVSVIPEGEPMCS